MPAGTQGSIRCRSGRLARNLLHSMEQCVRPGQLSAGESLLVHGGASGIGTTAVQLATAMGHKVYATVGSDESARAVEAVGAVQAINYRTQAYVEEDKKATTGKGVNVDPDMVAGESVKRNIHCQIGKAPCAENEVQKV